MEDGGLFYGPLVYFTALWSILRPFGLFTSIWYIVWPFDIFYGYLVYIGIFPNFCCNNKNPATLTYTTFAMLLFFTQE
jgi:hypothetical protein